jgi:hypothetical protein
MCPRKICEVKKKHQREMGVWEFEDFTELKPGCGQATPYTACGAGVQGFTAVSSSEASRNMLGSAEIS